MLTTSVCQVTAAHTGAAVRDRISVVPTRPDRSCPAEAKESVSFYSNLLGWAPTYDEGSQNELLIGDIGDVIVRGGNPLDPNFGKGGGRGGAGRIDHISFGIAPWDTEGVKAELEKQVSERKSTRPAGILGPTAHMCLTRFTPVKPKPSAIR